MIFEFCKDDGLVMFIFLLWFLFVVIVIDDVDDDRVGVGFLIVV